MKQLAFIAALTLAASAFVLKNEAPQTLIIDAGHGGHDPGATVNELREADIILEWAEVLKEEAEGRGLKVVMLREGDEFKSLEDRVEGIAEYSDQDAVVVSMHLNMNKDETVCGGTVITGTNASEASQLLAANIESHLDSLTKTERNEGEYFILNQSTLPAVIVNPGYLSNANDLEMIQSDSFKKQYANLLVSAILQ